MKNKLLGGWILAAAVATACLAGNVPGALAQPAAPDAAVSLPANIAPGSSLAEVIKLAQAGVDVGVIKTYIANAASAFNLDAEKIIALTDLGVPTELVNAMMEHDKNISAIVPTAPPPSAPAPLPVSVADNSATAAPTTEVDVNYFNDTLSPYGSWVEVEGYGRVWRPTTVIYDPNWQPYCDRGHWVYSDCGWYWDSDYSWGVTFHYGRWFHHDRIGWCWWPDTTWAPSWVTWRQSDAYCGWAPLPPFAIYRPGAGFSYRGARVAVGFDFGLPATCFTFVPVGDFCDRHPRSFRVEPRRGGEIFRQTTIINNYNDNHRVVINGGISVDRIDAGLHRPLVPVNVGALRNAERQGWRGPVTAADRAERNSPGAQFRNGPASRDDRNNGANANHQQNFGQPNQASTRNGNINSPARPQTLQTPGGANGQRDRDFNNHNASPSASAPQNQTSPVNTQPAPGTPFVRQQPSQNTPSQGSRPPGGNDRSQSANNHTPQQPQLVPANNVAAQNTTSAVNNHPVPGTPFVRQPPSQNMPAQGYRQPGGNDRSQSANNQNPQSSQFTPANNMPVRSAPTIDARPNRNYNDTAVAVAPPRSVPQVQQRPVIAPSAPPRVTLPPPSPAPAQNQPRNGGQNSGGANKDKPNN